MGKLCFVATFLALFSFVGIASYDTLLEVNAEIPKRVEVSVSKMFSSLELSGDLYETDAIFPGGIKINIRSNQASPFEVALFAPRCENGMFLLQGEGGSDIPFFLVDTRDGKRLEPNSIVYCKKEVLAPESVEIALDLVVPRQDESTILSKCLRGQVGINIQDI